MACGPGLSGPFRREGRVIGFVEVPTQEPTREGDCGWLTWV